MPDLRFVSSGEIAGLLSFPALIDAIEAAFRRSITVPVRHHHALPRPDGEATLLLMPAWTGEGSEADMLGTKLVTVFPGNGARGIESITGLYILNSGATGEPLAVMDARALTVWRTAAASALAARYLARADASRLALIGAGALAPHLARAHASVRPIRSIAIWNRTLAKAEALAQTLRAVGFDARAEVDRGAAIAGADIISSATLSPQPLVEGLYLSPGQHVDLVGGFTPTMREADDEAIRRSRVYVDTRAGAGKEAGDIVIPLASGLLTPQDIHGDLFELTAGTAQGRGSDQEITLFKSVGTAIEDLAAAELVWKALKG
ncbi:ornithine cyclodeaminase family protein [Ancylobacter dichloromethanicus]|uniref:Ornithine cyclodeaminase n=1 Tax=Ancylobacter dichloromethanicus TaxID=518825 RepID=A0A9W6MZD5_9HYPH|nr:ornithine cyclodeaminase family protein [Ancylobacter dichloromethanicus]MBS7552545.1 ornithine cyclodeaminase family protein [Ancylobacter dichloromethanicus]GLK71905.1 ornithine cyclodeaminase [Ancylobacter dichloromethanicus]